MLYFCAFAFFLMPVALYLEQPLMGGLFFVLAVLIGGFSVDPVKFSALLGLIVRFFPRLAVQHGRFENWMEFDLDWEETRR